MNQPSDQLNVLRLYEELGVRPEQGIDRLTERYRQRLRELHPDANNGAQGSDDGIGWITRSYREALAFERLHGRLPGAGGRTARDSSTPVPGTPDTWQSPPPRPSRRVRRQRRAQGHRRHIWRWLLFAIGLLLLIGLLAPELFGDDPVGRFPAESRER